MSFQWGRRAFLTAVGAGAAALPFFKLLERSAVGAQTLETKGFMGVYFPHGSAHELWQPGPDFDLTYENCSLAPFDDPITYGSSFKDQLLVVEGVALSAGVAGGTTGHSGSRVILTGSHGQGKNASLDQVLATQSPLGRGTRHSSLVLGVGNDLSGAMWNISYAEGGTALPKLVSPTNTFNAVFGDLAGDSAEAQATTQRRRQQGQSVLDFIEADLARLHQRLAPIEQQKLDQHLTALRELEKQLQDFELTCDVPGPPNAAQFPKVLATAGGARYLDRITDLQVDLLVQAFACDVTRIGTLYLGDLSNTGYDPSLPNNVHDNVAHLYSPRDEATWLPLAKQNRYSYSKIARLLQGLREADLLDTTIVYATSDMGDPSLHASYDVPTILTSGGAFQGGRYVNLARDGSSRSEFARVANNKILVSVAQACGVDVEEFGTATDPAVMRGALSELG